MAMTALGSRVVVIGNVPFGVSEEQLADIFREVGPVVSVRLMFDRDNKPRGYALCEYHDADTAKSAIRNLNNFDVGGRHLRVEAPDAEQLAELAASMGGGAGGGAPLPYGQGPPGPPMPPSAARGPPLPPGMAGPLGQGGAPPPHPEAVMDAIGTTLKHMSSAQMYDVMNQLKMMTQQEPEKARHLLLTNPQFTYVIVEALIMLGMVRTDVIHNILQPQTMGQPMPPPPPVGLPPPPMPPVGYYGGRYDGPPGLPPPGAFGGMPMMPGPPPLAVDDQQLMMQVRGMSTDQINAYPPDQRDRLLYARSRQM